jgi:hypothetical protein
LVLTLNVHVALTNLASVEVQWRLCFFSNFEFWMDFVFLAWSPSVQSVAIQFSCAKNLSKPTGTELCSTNVSDCTEKIKKSKSHFFRLFPQKLLLCRRPPRSRRHRICSRWRPLPATPPPPLPEVLELL